jgi:hypothetical protein
MSALHSAGCTHSVLLLKQTKIIYQTKIRLPTETITNENDTRIMVNTTGYSL